MDDFDREELERKKDTFGHWLNIKFAEFMTGQALHNNRTPSKTDWARYIGITNTNLSQYMNDNRKPDAAQADLLAAKLGPEVYDRLGMPRKMPKDKMLYFIVDNWPDVRPEKRKEIIERIKNEIDEKKREGHRNSGGSQALT